jgi:LacI family repressor for deo operon, udp, cdd, tsx, nupC, and nupG
MQTKSVTIRDLAIAAGVSIGTVSRALKNQPGPSAQTRSGVVKLAQELGYDLSKLRVAKPRRMLFVFSRAHASLGSSPFYPGVLQGVEQACRGDHVSLSLLSIGPGDPVPAWVRRREADALLAAGHFDTDLLAQLRATELPMVAVDQLTHACFCVNGDNLQGAWLATRHLIEQGNRRIAMISGPAPLHSVALRVRGFRKALFEAGHLADPDLEVSVDPALPQVDAAMQAMHRLLALPRRPDAVFAYNDETALNAMQACREAGLSVPGDIAFAGYGDIESVGRGRPVLTTVRVDQEELGRQAAGHLIMGNVEAGEELLPAQLLVRDSSGRR